MIDFNLDILTFDQLITLETKLHAKIEQVKHQKAKEAAQKIKSLMDEINDLSYEYDLDISLDIYDYEDTAFYDHYFKTF